MKIRRLHIENFRGFSEADFRFDDSLAVVVGNNATGKTTLLQALQVALGAWLASLQQAQQLPPDKAYTRNFSNTDVLRRYSAEQRDYIVSDRATKVEVEAVLSADTVSEPRTMNWSRVYKHGRVADIRRSAGELKAYVDELADKRQHDIHVVMPVILSFGVNRIDNQYRDAVKKLRRATRLERAYKSALQEAVDFRSAYDWLYRYDRAIEESTEFEGTREAFLHALTEAIPALGDIHIDSKNHELSARVAITGLEPEYHTYDTMSDGMKAMLNIVAEIAYRCVLLNGFLGREAVHETPGVVIIDELDIYLHPRWQRHILADLRRAFPKIQFIVSSHSPFIIQSVKTENIITLDGATDATDPLYRSIEEIAEREMNMGDTARRSQRYQDMLRKAEQFFRLVKEGKDNDLLYREYTEAEAEFSDNPAYLALLRAERDRR